MERLSHLPAYSVPTSAPQSSPVKCIWCLKGNRTAKNWPPQTNLGARCRVPSPALATGQGESESILFFSLLQKEESGRQRLVRVITEIAGSLHPCQKPHRKTKKNQAQIIGFWGGVYPHVEFVSPVFITFSLFNDCVDTATGCTDILTASVGSQTTRLRTCTAPFSQKTDLR